MTEYILGEARGADGLLYPCPGRRMYFVSGFILRSSHQNCKINPVTLTYNPPDTKYSILRVS